MQPIQLATVLPGADRFSEGNVNATFRGQILLSDGSVQGAILKDLDARQLANELIVSALAKHVGLPTPDSYLALVRNGDLSLAAAPALPDGNQIVFASVDVKAPNITFRIRTAPPEQHGRLMKEILEWRYLGGLYGFDAWVANIDRHPGNLLFGKNGEFWLIDHGHCFSGPRWTGADLKSDGNYINRLSQWLTSEMSDNQKKKRLDEVFSKTKDFASIDISSIENNTWVVYLLNKNEALALSRFLDGRIEHVPLHASAALGMGLLV